LFFGRRAERAFQKTTVLHTSAKRYIFRSKIMATNRRAFLTTSAIGAASFVGTVTAGKASAQPSSSVAPANQAVAQTQSVPVNTARQLAGKVAIVTGARANLGRGFAVALAQQGADVVVHYHRAETVTEAEETARLVQEQGSRADILINNAGAIVKKPIAEVTDEDLERMININTRGNFLFDLLILDLGLPDANGLKVLEAVRGQGAELPIIILTACDGLDDTISGLEGGADDYMTKPFRFEELLRLV
jgi:CheY-like chemotaxis protein